MNFTDVINEFENKDFNVDYIIKKGNVPILFTAVHTMKQIKEDGIKLREPYTKAIALYLNEYYDVSCMVKLKDTGEDSNKDNNDEFKKELINFIKENDIKIVIDLHGSKKDREFDIELGTLDDLSADYSTIKEFEEAFRKNKIDNIANNDPFKGGAITQYVYKLKDVEAIQVEINAKYRDYENPDNLERVCNSFRDFIKEYMKR